MRRFRPFIIATVLALAGAGSAVAVNSAVRSAVQLPADVVLESGSEGVQAPDAPPAADASAPPPADASAAPPEGAPPAAGEVPADAPKEPSKPRGRTLQQYRDAIVVRNIFDHTATPETAGGAGEAAPSDLNLRLVATLVAEPSKFSSALIVENGKEGSAKGYGIGDKIGDAEVTAIEARRVTLLRASGTTEYLLLEDKPAAPPSAPTDAKPAENAEGGISQLGENRYAVDRAVVDKHLTDLTALASMARAVPHRGPDGEVDGYRLSGVRRNSTLYQLGIRNGDVVHTVNGSSLMSMQDAMAAYQGLQSQARFNFEITRRGQRQTMEYEVR